LRNRLTDRFGHGGTGIALGWVPDMAALIRSSDVVVQNAGGLTVWEALACGVPVVSYRCVAGHGRANTDALEQADRVPWARDNAALAVLLRDAVAGGRRVPRPTYADPTRLIAELAATADQASAALVGHALVGAAR